jgi:hypothetical protein
MIHTSIEKTAASTAAAVVLRAVRRRLGLEKKGNVEAFQRKRFLAQVKESDDGEEKKAEYESEVHAQSGGNQPASDSHVDAHDCSNGHDNNNNNRSTDEPMHVQQQASNIDGAQTHTTESESEPHTNASVVQENSTMVKTKREPGAEDAQDQGTRSDALPNPAEIDQKNDTTGVIATGDKSVDQTNASSHVHTGLHAANTSTVSSHVAGSPQSSGQTVSTVKHEQVGDVKLERDAVVKSETSAADEDQYLFVADLDVCAVEGKFGIFAAEDMIVETVCVCVSMYVCMYAFEADLYVCDVEGNLGVFAAGEMTCETLCMCLYRYLCVSQAKPCICLKQHLRTCIHTYMCLYRHYVSLRQSSGCA